MTGAVKREATDSQVLLELESPVAKVILDSPPVNPLSRGVYRQLLHAFEAIESAPHIRVVVCCASERCRSFSAGADVKDFESLFEDGSSREFFELAHKVIYAVRQMPQITIAAMDGDVLGGGAELALAFDLRLGTSNGRFGFPELTIGQFPGPDGTVQLPQGIGLLQARSTVLSAELISMDRARELGLVDYVVPSGLARVTGVAWAQRLSDYPAQAVRAAKASLRASTDENREDAASEVSIELSDWVFRSDDSREGHLAFVEKRPAMFQHDVPPLPEVGK